MLTFQQKSFLLKLKTPNLMESNHKTPTVLIIDDDSFNRLILTEILRRNNCEGIQAEDGYMALNLLEKVKPDIILLDIMMPGMDGYEVCKRIKENQNHTDIPIIFISSLSDTKDIVKALKYGAVDYIAKPFQAEEVTARVNTHLKLYQQSKELIELNSNLNKSKEQINNFATHLLIVREEERAFLSTEIHDKIGQILVALKIDMGIWKKKTLFLSENSESLELLKSFNELVGIVDDTINTVRKIMSDLKSDNLELLGFIETAKLYGLEFELINKINCEVISSESNLIFNEQQKVALFRILQEALSNVAKHSKANSVKVSLSKSNGFFSMEIEDDGIGYDKNQTPTSNSFGVLDMEERVKIIEGKLTIITRSGIGTRVKVQMPYFDSNK